MAEAYDPAVYQTNKWFKSLEYTREWNERALYAAMSILGKPDSFLDIGCGDGSLVTMMGTVVSGFCGGVEMSPTHPMVFQGDLRNQFDLHLRCALTISWEVGEHLPEASADTYCDNVARHVGEWLVFTAAHPGQGGEYHINEQPKAYWRDKLEARGLVYAGAETGHLAEVWRWATGPCWWLPTNVQVFKGEV
jgi:hypothetical protein